MRDAARLSIQRQDSMSRAQEPLLSLVLPILKEPFIVPFQALFKHYKQLKADYKGEDSILQENK